MSRSALHSSLGPLRRPSIYGMGFLALDIVQDEFRDRPIRVYAGGTCGNVLAILAYMGWEAHPIARLNGDPASLNVKQDLRRIGVKLNLASIAPTVSTPIVIQVINRHRRIVAQHRFEWACLGCGNALPRFKPVPANAVAEITRRVKQPSVFFMDRVSRSSLNVAESVAGQGALIYFEPSEISNPRLFSEALQLVHVLKYSRDRLPSLEGYRTQALIEIQTLGARGLVYRSRLSATRGWLHLPSVNARKVVDSCGAGDWCTAGFISQVGEGGLDGLCAASSEDVVDALRFGQALAAWNCGFEGARGGMYEVDSKRFIRQVQAILGSQYAALGRFWNRDSVPNQRISSVECPACKPRKGLRYRAARAALV